VFSGKWWKKRWREYKLFIDNGKKRGSCRILERGGGKGKKGEGNSPPSYQKIWGGEGDLPSWGPGSRLGRKEGKHLASRISGTAGPCAK